MFSEERLELGIDYGAVGGMKFNTIIIESGDGGQQRNANWWLPLGRWQLGDRTLLESEIDKLEEVTYLRNFQADRKGSLQGFRFKDWSDYQVKKQVLAIGDGNTSQYQLKKTYYAGSASCDRPITKPVEGTVKVYFDGVEQATGWAVDYTTGIITFTTTPAVNVVIKLSFEFDVPVWFESDAIGWRLQAYQEGEAIYKLENVFVEEGRILLTLPWDIQPLPDLSNEVLDLGIIYETVEATEYQTSKQKLSSGYVRRDDNYNAPITKVNLGDHIFDKAELDNLLGFFWCAKGKNKLFYLRLAGQLYAVFFNQDQLNLKFSAKEENEILFNVSSLQFLSFGSCDLNNQIATKEFIDTEFDLNNWQKITLIKNCGGTATASQAVTDGNPGNFLEISLDINANLVDFCTVYGYFFNHVFSFTPRLEGVINSITYSEDYKLINSTSQGNEGQARGFVLIQDNKIYASGSGITGVGSTWSNYQSTLLQNNFIQVGFVNNPYQTVNGNQHPNFSLSGNKIIFGFGRWNTSALSTTGYSTVGGIDNWHIILNLGCQLS